MALFNAFRGAQLTSKDHISGKGKGSSKSINKDV
jgi:hypothetical protein